MEDYSSLSDEELIQAYQASLSDESAPLQEPAPLQEQPDYEQMSDDELIAAYRASLSDAQPVAPRPSPSPDEIRERNNARIARAMEYNGESPDDIAADALEAGAKGAARAAKSGVGALVVSPAASLVRLAGTPVRALTGWDGLHRLADTIDEGYANWGADALAADDDGWMNHVGEHVTSTAGTIGALAAGGGAASAVAKAAGGGKVAMAAAKNLLPAVFGNDAAVRAYDTARQTAELKGEDFDADAKARALGLAAVNAAIHFFGFKAFENQSLNKLLKIPQGLEAQMPKFANAAKEAGANTYTGLVDGVRNGMFKAIVAERGANALKAGGIMGLQNFLSDIPTQMAEGADFGDVDWGRAAKQGLGGVGEGGAMEGLMAAASAMLTPREARRFVSDTYFRKGYRLPNGEKVDGLLNSPEGRQFIMKQNPEAQSRILDIVSHGGKVSPEELDAACLPTDMTAREIKKFADDWGRDLSVEELRDAAGDEFLGDAGDELDGETPRPQTPPPASGGEPPVAERPNRLRRATPNNFRHVGDPDNRLRPQEQQTPTQQEATADEAGNVRDEAPAQAEPGVERQAEPEAPRPEAEAAPRDEAPDGGVVGPPSAERPVEPTPAEAPKTAPVSEGSAEGTTTPPKGADAPQGAESPSNAAPAAETAELPKPASRRLRRRDGADPLAEKEVRTEPPPAPEPPTENPAREEEAPARPAEVAAAPAPEAPKTPLSRARRDHFVDKIRPILDVARREDGSFDPDAFRNRKGNGGFVLGKLKEANEHMDEIVEALGLPAEDATAFRAAMEEAYNRQRVATPNSKEGKVSEAGQFNYSVSASKALERLAKHPDNPKAFAIAQQQVSAALEAAKRQTDENGRKNEKSISFWQARLDELNTKFDALPKETQGAILRQAQSLQGKLQSTERKGRKSNTTAEGEELDIADEGRDMGEDNIISDEQAEAQYGDEARFGRAAASETKTETDNEKNSAGILRDTDKDLGRRGIRLEAKDGKVNVVWRNDMGDVVRRAPLDMLEKAAKKDPGIKDLIERLKQGEQIRAAKTDASDLPDAWTPETQKPLEDFADKVLKPTGLVKDFEFAPRPEKVDGANAIMRKDGTVVGEYDRETGKARFFPGARPEDVTHEFTHGLFQHAEKEAAAGRPQLKETIDNLVKAMPKVWKDAVGEKYADRPAAEVLEEIFTNGLARLGETGVKGIDAKTGEIIPGSEGFGAMAKAMRTLEGKAWYNRAWNAIKELYRDFMRRHGWYNARLDNLDKMSPDEAARHILSEMAKGRSFGNATTGGEGTRNAMSDSPSSISARLGRIRDWFYGGGEDNYTFKNHPADWSKSDRAEAGFDRMSVDTRLAEAVGALENPQEFWKAFLPTGTRRVAFRTKNGNVVLFRDVNDAVMGGRFGYTTATERAASGKYGKGGAIHFLLEGHIAEGGYKTSKSVLTAKEINDNFQRCLDSPVKYDKQNRPYHEVDIGHGVKMRISTRFLEVDGRMAEVPITMTSTRRDGDSMRVCERVAKEMSEKKPVHLSAQGGAATSTRTADSISNPPAESQEGAENISPVRESRRVALPTPTAKDFGDWIDGKDDVRRKLRRALQDKDINIRDVEEGLGITDKNESAYYAKNRAFGKNEHELTVLQKQEVEPIVEKIHKSGGDLGLFSAYLYARHAGERNAVLKAEKGVDNGSGMSDEQAKTIFDAVDRQGLRAAFEDAAKDVWAMNRKYLQRRVDAGLMTQAEAKFLTDRYEHYVPLRTDMTNEELDIFNSTTGGWKRNETTTAKGRKSAADDPLAFSIVQNEQAIRASNANEVRKRWAGVVRRAKGELGEIVDGVTFGDGETVETGSPMNLASERDDIILFKENGRLKAIKMKPGEHGRGKDLARAVTDKDVAKFNEYLEWIPRATRWMSAMRTQYVPTFIVRNLKADNLEVLLNALSERGLRGENGKSGGISFFGKFLKNEIGVAKGVREYFKTGKSSDRYVQEAVENGLLTGGGMAAEGFTETARRLSDTLQALRERPKLLGGTFKAAKDMISLLNACAEYNTRMGVYKTLREEGMSVADAVSYARDVTVNFNRKGFVTPYTNAAFMFSNAAVQGMGRAFKSMKSEHGKGVLVGLFMVGVAQALLDDWLGHDDEKAKTGGADSRNMTEYDKEHSLGVALPTGHRVKTGIRNPWALPMYAGRKTVELVKGITSGEQAMKDLANAVGNFVTEPVGGNGFGSKAETFQTLMPTIIDPLVQWSTGKDYKGEDRVKRSFDKTQPQSWNGKDRTPEVYKLVAQGLNALTGGNEFRKGGFDSAPEDWQLLTETVFGGVLADLNNLVKAGGHAVDAVRGKPASQIARDVPFVRDTITNLPENTNRYFAALDEYERDKAEFKKVKDLKRRADMRRDMPYLTAGTGRVDNLISRVKDLAHLKKGEVRLGRKWAEPRTPVPESRKEAYRKQQLQLQAEILRILGR